MKVKCISKYYDRVLGKLVTPADKTYEVEDRRGKILVSRKVAEEVKDVKPSKQALMSNRIQDSKLYADSSGHTLNEGQNEKH